MSKVVILDHGSGNLRSAERAFARAGAAAAATRAGGPGKDTGANG